MLPAFRIPDVELGPITLHSFGLLVAVGVLAGTQAACWHAKKHRLDPKVPWDAFLWALVPGFVVAHLFAVLLYTPERIPRDPLVLVRIFDGISSFGGFLGGTLGILVYLRRRRLPFWPYADAVAVAFSVAWIFGRLGCTSMFDHPGVLSDFFLAMPYSGTEVSHGMRHNLGLYEVLWSVAMLAFFLTQERKQRFPGFYAVTLVLAYTPYRFALDFLRAADLRYAGLTAGQYAAVALLLIAGSWGFIQWRASRLTPAPEQAPTRAPTSASTSEAA